MSDSSYVSGSVEPIVFRELKEMSVEELHAELIEWRKRSASALFCALACAEVAKLRYRITSYEFSRALREIRRAMAFIPQAGKPFFEVFASQFDENKDCGERLTSLLKHALAEIREYPGV